MLPLDSSRWNELRHAYGAAGDVPELLRALAGLPGSDGNDEPWFSLWSTLAHQGDVYAASFAAVPHVVAALATDPVRAPADYFHFPAWVEVCRHRQSVPIPPDLEPAYASALARLPGLVAAASSRPWDAGTLHSALAATAAAHGQAELAHLLLELVEPGAVRAALEWLEDR